MVLFVAIFAALPAVADTDALTAAEAYRNQQIYMNSMKEAGCSGIGDLSCGTKLPEKAPVPQARPNPSNSDATKTSADPCAEAERAVASCESKARAVDGDACSTDSNNPAMRDAYDTTEQESSDSQASGTGDTCSKPKKSASKTNAGLSKVRSNCQAAYSSCSDACSAAANAVASCSRLGSRLSGARARCESANGKIAGMDAGMNHMNDTADKSTNCKNDVNDGSGGGGGGGSNDDSIKDRTDCTGEYAAQNPACGTKFGNPNLNSATPNTGGIGDSGNTGSNFGDAGNDGSGGGSADSPGGGFDPSGGGSGLGVGIRPDLNGGLSGSVGRDGGESDKKEMKGALSQGQIQKMGGTNYGGGGFGRGASGGSISPNGSWIPPKVGVKKADQALPDLNRFRPDMNMRLPASADGSDLNKWACRKPWQSIWDGPNERHDAVMRSAQPLSLSP